MRWARYFTFLVPLLLLVTLPHAALAFSLDLNPIAGYGQCSCPGSAPDWGCVLYTFQIVFNDFTVIATLLITLFIGYAGFTFMMSPLNEEKRIEARNRLLNAVIGLLIVLCAYLLVSSLMAVLYNGKLGAWNALLKSNGNDYCIQETKAGSLPGISVTQNAGGSGTLTLPGGTVGTNNAPNVRGDCTPSGLQSDGMNAGIAAKMSCITKSEDASCALGAKSGTDIGSDGNSVSIGMFQINISANNLSQYPACEAAVNNQPLNCTQAFGGGAYTASNHRTHVTNSSLYSTCVAAASNAQCNVQAAQDQYLNHGGSRNWGTAAQSNCGT